MTAFGSLLRKLRQESGLTQQQLARKMGASKSYISGIESGKVRPPSPKLIRKLTRLFRYDERELLRLACVEKAPQLIRSELQTLMFPEAVDNVAVVCVPVLNTVQSGYSVRIGGDGHVAPIVDFSLVVPRSSAGPDCAITVCDDSMEQASGASFTCGDVAMLARSPAVEDGAISYLVYSAGTRRLAAFRRLWLKQNGRVALEALKPDYPAVVIATDAVLSVYRVLGKLQMFMPVHGDGGR